MTAKQCDILFVCHANQCRSPMAERLMRREIRARLGRDDTALRVRSAGTHAWNDRTMHPLAADVLQECGADPAGFRSRRLTAELVTEADLVLTATRWQRGACVALVPGAVRRTFTLRQFGRFVAAMSIDRPSTFGPPTDRLGRLIEQVSVVRGELPVGGVEQDDLDDPVDQPIEAFRRCRARIEHVVQPLTMLIASTRGGRRVSTRRPANLP